MSTIITLGEDSASLTAQFEITSRLQLGGGPLAAGLPRPLAPYSFSLVLIHPLFFSKKFYDFIPVDVPRGEGKQ